MAKASTGLSLNRFSIGCLLVLGDIQIAIRFRIKLEFSALRTGSDPKRT